LLFEREYCHKQKVYEGDESQAIGLDFSPEEFYINSDGSSGKDFGYVAQKQKNLKKLTKLQRRLARKQVGSNNREKARVKVARMEHYIAECRNDWIEKETKRLVSTYQVIGIEDLNLKGMMKFSKNAIKNVGQGVSEFRSVEGVEDLATLALQIGASEEAENLTGDGQNVLTLL